MSTMKKVSTNRLNTNSTSGTSYMKHLPKKENTQLPVKGPAQQFDGGTRVSAHIFNGTSTNEYRTRTIMIQSQPARNLSVGSSMAMRRAISSVPSKSSWF